MAKWMARSQGKLIKRLQLAVQPTEGQSTAAPQWHNLDIEGLEDLVALVNDKTESNRVLIEQVNALKAEIQQLKYGRPATGGFVDYPPEKRRLFGEASPGREIPTRERHPSLADCVSKFAGKPLPDMFPLSHQITPVPGVITVINAPDASNGEIEENVRRQIAEVSRHSWDDAVRGSRAECITRLDSSTFNRDSCDTPTNTDSSSPTPSE